MRNTTYYEWTIEWADEFGDIHELDHCEAGQLRQSEFMDYRKTDGLTPELSLCRRVGNDEDGEQYREYAYVRNAQLPAEFDDGYVVPKKFHAELSNI